MSSTENIISKASAHTIKKFELIEKYVEEWAQILLNYEKCKQLVFIDCMSNSGEYYDADGRTVYGTPVRVSHVLQKAAESYPQKRIDLYFNDLSQGKIDHLKSLVDKDSHNFFVHLSTMDGNDLLRRIGSLLTPGQETHYLLVYDPYQAAIDWVALMPFLNNWGEVIINHMLYDSIRATKLAKRDTTISKYEQTYLTDIENLIPYGNDKAAYEARIEAIIHALHRGERRYYVAAFPFFNSKNAIVYNLIHCTGNIAGFKLYKKKAWQVFGGKSSTKNTHGLENQLSFLFDETDSYGTRTDENCYYVPDIASYLQSVFRGRRDVPLNEIWSLLETHPVFPSDGFRPEIKRLLKVEHGAIIGRSSVTFSDRK